MGGKVDILLPEPVGTDQAYKRCLRQQQREFAHVAKSADFIQNFMNQSSLTLTSGLLSIYM
jgi:hypothetical protein